MFAINDLDDLRHLEEHNKVVAVFLADGLYPNEARWLGEVWHELHERSGMRWHVAVPTRRPVRNGRFTPSALHGQFAADLARIYGLSEQDFPCLVFDNFRDDTKQLKINIPNGEARRRELVLAIDYYLQRANEQRDEARELTIAGLYNFLQRQGAVSSLVSLAPRIASAAFRIATGTLAKA